MKTHPAARLADPDAPLRATVALLRERELLARRRALRRIGGAALLASPAGALACSLIPSETAGPYPGDGSNGPNALTQIGIVRADIRASFGKGGTTIAPGTPLTLTLKLVNVNDNCAPVAGYAVYVWHCDASGRYSMYSPNVTCSTTSARATDADFAHSGNWFAESTTGQGLVIEVNPSAHALFCTWYTYAPIGGPASQRWYTAQASHAAGARSFDLTLYETTGGTFASAATAATTAAVGTATLTFASCQSATLAYAFTGGTNAGQAGTIALTRVGSVPAGCA